MITVTSKGDFKKTRRFLKNAEKENTMSILQKYAQVGLEALTAATPVDSGQTANSWYYKITNRGHLYYLTFCNSNVEDGAKIAVILDLGHGTSNGGYVQGRNYIRPAILPIFDDIAISAWKEITDA